jgi:hypothetical protein
MRKDMKMRDRISDLDCGEYATSCEEYEVPYECCAIIDKLLELTSQYEQKNIEILEMFDEDPDFENAAAEKKYWRLCLKQNKIKAHREALKEQIIRIVFFALKARRGEINGIDPVPLAYHLNRFFDGPFKLFATFDDNGRRNPYPSPAKKC